VGSRERAVPICDVCSRHRQSPEYYFQNSRCFSQIIRSLVCIFKIVEICSCRFEKRQFRLRCTHRTVTRAKWFQTCATSRLFHAFHPSATISISPAWKGQSLYNPRQSSLPNSAPAALYSPFICNTCCCCSCFQTRRASTARQTASSSRKRAFAPTPTTAPSAVSRARRTECSAACGSDANVAQVTQSDVRTNVSREQRRRCSLQQITRHSRLAKRDESTRSLSPLFF